MLAAEMTNLGVICLTILALSFMGCVTYLLKTGSLDG